MYFIVQIIKIPINKTFFINDIAPISQTEGLHTVVLNCGHPYKKKREQKTCKKQDLVNNACYT